MLVFSPQHLPSLLLGTGDLKVAKPGACYTDQPQPFVYYGCSNTYESQILEKFFPGVLKPYFTKNWCNYFQVVYLDNAGTWSSPVGKQMIWVNSLFLMVTAVKDTNEKLTCYCTCEDSFTLRNNILCKYSRSWMLIWQLKYISGV